MSKLTELREARQKAHADLSAVLALAPSAENNERARKIIADMDVTKAEIDKIESRGLSQMGEVIKGDKNVEVRRAFQNYLRNGEQTDRESREILKNSQRDGVIEGNLPNHIGTYTDLGYFVPTGFVNAIDIATKWYADLMNVCGSIGTASASPLPYPTSDDTANSAVWLGESQAVVEKDITAGQVVFNAWKASTGMIKASVELVQDSAFDLESFVAEAMGVRLGRLYESAFTNGSGSSQPTGFLTAISNGGITPVITLGSNSNSGLSGDTSANSIGWADLVDLEHAVDKSYRRGAAYMMHDQTLAALKRVLDRFGRPLYQPGVSGDVDRLNGYPVVLNNSMPQIAASAVSIAFGDWKKFMIRKAADFKVLVLRERFADNGQVGFIGFARVDSNLINKKALAVLQQTS